MLAAVRNGEHFHIRGIAARLRLLLHDGGQTPLLMIVAGFKNLPLIVYTGARPRAGPLPIPPSVGIFHSGISAVKTQVHVNPVDIDEWLKLYALQLGNEIYSNARLLVDIGNTIGAHLDPKIAPSVFSLRSGKTTFAEVSMTHLVRYLAEVGDSVLALCKFVIAEPSRRGGVG